MSILGRWLAMATSGWGGLVTPGWLFLDPRSLGLCNKVPVGSPLGRAPGLPKICVRWRVTGLRCKLGVTDGEDNSVHIFGPILVSTRRRRSGATGEFL